MGGASGIGREVAHLLAQRGAHVVVADRDQAGAAKVAADLKSVASAEALTSAAVDITSRESISNAMKIAVGAFGGVDILVNTAALFPSSPDPVLPDRFWASTLDANVTANYLLATEAAKIFNEQGLHGTIVFTSSANAVVSKKGSEAYDKARRLSPT